MDQGSHVAQHRRGWDLRAARRWPSEEVWKARTRGTPPAVTPP